MDTSIGLIPLDEESQRVLIYDLLEYGADKTLCVGDKYIPYDLVKVERKMARALLKVSERRNNEKDTFIQQTQSTHDNRNDVSNGTGTSSYHYPPNHLDIKQTNILDDKNNANASTTSGQSGISLYDHQNRPPSSSSSLLSTLSPTSSVVMGKDDPFICGGTTPSYTDGLNIGVDTTGSPTSNGGGSQQQSPQSVVNHPFYNLYNSSSSDGFGRISRTSVVSHGNSISSTANASTFYNCYDSLSDSDGERIGTGDSGNESPSSDNPSYARCIIQEAFGQQPSRTQNEDVDSCDVDLIAARLYNHPTIQAVINNADTSNGSSGGFRQSMLQNNL